MSASQAPGWRRAFDTAERAIGEPLAVITSSTDFQIAAQQVQRLTAQLSRPVQGVVSWGLHLAGLPSYQDMRALRGQLIEVQREVVSLRRDLIAAQYEDGGPP